MSKLLVIDDEPELRSLIEEVFAEDRFEILGAETGEAGLKLASEQKPEVVLLDMKLSDRDGMEVFEHLRSMIPKSHVVFITGHSSPETAIESMKLGAYDYLVKPVDIDQLQKVVRQAFEISRLMRVPTYVEGGERAEDLPHQLIGRGPAMQAICKEIGRVAAQDVNVLILGESGTGKELVARAIYHHSHRNEAPLLTINCAAIPESLLESELFGHEKGAFTSADQRRIGKFEQSNGGTLFLDEIGDMAPNTQAKILRVLQERSFERVGGNQTISADVRIIAATNQNLEAQIEAGKFRKDLYYRLRGVTIHLPPLRERREDIPQLAHYFLFRFNRELGTEVQSISPETLERLGAYSWPGNVREMESVIREALLRSSGVVLLPEFLPPELLQEEARDVEAKAPSGSEQENDWHNLSSLIDSWLAAGETGLYHRGLEHFDRLLITRALQHAGGNQTRVAEILGMSRATLRARLRSLGLTLERVVADSSGTDFEGERDWRPAGRSATVTSLPYTNSESAYTPR